MRCLKGEVFSVSAVSVERPASAPILRPASLYQGQSRDGGVQGLGWLERTEMVDEDGDRAHGFIDADERR